MPHLHRRSVLAAIASASLLIQGTPAMAEEPELRGSVVFADDATIPKGDLRIYLDVPGSDAAQPAPSTDLSADGKATAIDFVLAPSASADLESAQVVARLEREDGVLLARGSAPARPGAPVRIVLYSVMY